MRFLILAAAALACLSTPALARHHHVGRADATPRFQAAIDRVAFGRPAGVTQFCGDRVCGYLQPARPRYRAARDRHLTAKRPPRAAAQASAQPQAAIPLPRPRPLDLAQAPQGNLLDAFRRHVAEIVEPVRAGYVAITTASGRRVIVAERFAWRFAGFLRDLEATGYRIADIGGYCYRRIAGTRHLSKHAFGAAIDVNQVERNVVTARLPRGISGMAAQWGLKSGGDWRGNPDLGHFEVASADARAPRHRRVHYAVAGR